MQDFIFVEHTADLQLQIFGKDLPELFINAMRGLFHVIGPQIPGARLVDGRFSFDRYDIEKVVEARAPHQDILLVHFLSELLYFADIHNCAFFDATIETLSDTYVKARVRGKLVSRIDLEVKAVTYHDAWIKHENGFWQANIVFDI